MREARAMQSVGHALSFENIAADLLAPHVTNVIAHYRLTRGDSNASHGPTSLVMRRRGDHCRNMHHHSS